MEERIEGRYGISVFHFTNLVGMTEIYRTNKLRSEVRSYPLVPRVYIKPKLDPSGTPRRSLRLFMKITC